MLFLVTGQKINSQKWSISLDLRQVGAVSYTTTPNWYSYENDSLPVITNPYEPVYYGDMDATYGLSPTQETAIIGTVALEPDIVEAGVIITSVDDIANYDTGQHGVIGDTSLVRARLDSAAETINGHASDISGLLSTVGLQTADLIAINADIVNKTADIVSLNATVAGLITNDYDAGTTYYLNDYVRNSGIVYRCIATTTGNAPPNLTYWESASSIMTLVTSLQEDVDTISGQISSKVSQSTYDTKTGELDDTDSAIIQRADQIISRVDSTTLQLLGGAEWDATRIYTAIGFRIHYLGDIYELSQGMVAAHATTPPLDTAFWDLVATPTARLITAESAITQNSGDITIQAQTITGPLTFEAGVVEASVVVETVEDVAGMDVRISESTIKADSASAQVLLQTSALDALTGRLTSAEITLDGANAAIILRATKNELSGEVEILNDSINLKVDSATILTAGYINGVPGIGINGNVMVDGSVYARHIATGQLTVGSNVALGTAQDSAGVTTIIGNTVTTSFINALNVTAQSVAAENITGTTITGKTFQTVSTGNQKIIISADNNQAEFWGDYGNGSSTKLVIIGFDYTVLRQTNACSNFGTNATGNFLTGASTATDSGFGLLATAESGYGAYLGQDFLTTYRKGIEGFSGKSPCRLAPGKTAGTPTHSAEVGSLWVDTDGILYIQTTWRSGTGWQKVGAQ